MGVEAETSDVRQPSATAGPRKLKKKRKAKVEKTNEKSEEQTKVRRKKRKAPVADTVEAIDPVGAEEDAHIMRTLGKQLGIAGTDDKKRRKQERALFTGLGLNDDLGGGAEEPPSSDDEGGDPFGSDAEFGDLLDGILDAVR